MTYPQSFHIVGAMTEILSISIVVAALALIALGYRAVGVFSRSIDRPGTVAEPQAPLPRLKWDDEAIADLSHRMDILHEAVALGITKVERNENRIQKTVTSARRAVREAGLEHAGIEAEYEDIQPPDDPGVEPLPPVPESVDEGRTVRIPGGHLTIGVG